MRVGESRDKRAIVIYIEFRWTIGKRIEKIRNEEIITRAGVANISEKIREARLRWLGHVERKIEEDVVMITWKMDVGRQ